MMAPRFGTYFGYRCVIYPGDHAPMHFHVIKGRLKCKFYVMSTGELLLDTSTQVWIPSKDIKKLIGFIDVLAVVQLWNSVNPALANCFYDTYYGYRYARFKN